MEPNIQMTGTNHMATILMVDGTHQTRLVDGAHTTPKKESELFKFFSTQKLLLTNS